MEFDNSLVWLIGCERSIVGIRAGSTVIDRLICGILHHPHSFALVSSLRHKINSFYKATKLVLFREQYKHPHFLQDLQGGEEK